jgi:DNA mismatch repair protein MutS2
MDDKSLEMLEFPRIREILAGYTTSPVSFELAIRLSPLDNYERISHLLKQSAEARSLLRLDRSISIGNVLDVREIVKRASLESTLEPQNLLDIKQTLSSLHQVRRYIEDISTDFPLLWHIARDIVDLYPLEKEIVECLDPAGQVVDSASPILADIRQQLREIRAQILERLETIINSPRGRRILQEDIITEREGRYVVLVKTESRHEIKGIVHDISNTGATVFVEPTVNVGLGNALRELVIEERREVERILGMLSAEVGKHCDEIQDSIMLAAELDLVFAKARYAHKLKASEPVIIMPDEGKKAARKNVGRYLRLLDARHPLLGDNAVPFSVEIGCDFSVLVITGPNTGGKTVTLKTLGLLSLMCQAGIPIPASEESRLPLFDSIFADIGDEQSIEQTLSSFSWHMSNAVRIIRQATAGSLVLLDELGTSTDPAEGSALARAILRHFLSRGTLTVATTHYSDLKAFAHATPRMQNASLEFDPVTLSPTYKLTIGIPGGSNAMATATRLGIPAEIIDDARSMLSEGSQELEATLTALMEEKQKAASLYHELNAEKDNLVRIRTELEKEKQELANAEKNIVREARDNIVKEAAQLHNDIRRAVGELRREKSATSLQQARQTLAEVRDRINGNIWKARTILEQETDDSTLNIGDTVRLKDTGFTATVLSISEESREIEVQTGRTKLRISLDSVIKTPSPAELSSSMVTNGTDFRMVPLELDLRGKRADEVEIALDTYLNDAVRSNISEVRIIHGIGTGTVRGIVREFLASHPLVKSFRSADHDKGGDGATMVNL